MKETLLSSQYKEQTELKEEPKTCSSHIVLAIGLDETMKAYKWRYSIISGAVEPSAKAHSHVDLQESTFNLY